MCYYIEQTLSKGRKKIQTERISDSFIQYYIGNQRIWFPDGTDSVVVEMNKSHWNEAERIIEKPTRKPDNNKPKDVTQDEINVV
jgi:hypothetical protein